MPGTHPYPNLQVHPMSGLSFPWSFYNPAVMSLEETALGPEGVTAGADMLIFWEDLETAVSELLGYSWRDTSTIATIGVSTLRRVLPWQHPYWNQLWVRRIASVKGLRSEGTDQQAGDAGEAQLVAGPGGGAGVGFKSNKGPWSNFLLAKLTIEWWRPPYFIRTDADILDDTGLFQQEWLRYVDKKWEMQPMMLHREGQMFGWLNPGNANNSQPGTVGLKTMHYKVTRRWYEVPEAAIFESLTDLTPNGLPTNFVYTQTPTINPITFGVGNAGSNAYTQPAGYPIGGCVNSPIGGGVDDSDPDNRFFGCIMGTLLYEGVEFIPRPLQLPPWLMQIPDFSVNEAISQLQYDVVMHFDLFEPPKGSLEVFHGWNLAPWSGNGLWYAIRTIRDVFGTMVGPYTTLFQYADLTDLFQIL